MKPIHHFLGIAAVLTVLWRLQGIDVTAGMESPDANLRSTAPVATDAIESGGYQAGSGTRNPDEGPRLANDIGGVRVSTAITTFMGTTCPQEDCSNELAGYRWAEENKVTDPGDCPGLFGDERYGDFATGCRLYAVTEQKYNI